MKISELTLVTSNKAKAAELSDLLSVKVSRVAIDLPEIQSLDEAEVATEKAKAAYEILKIPVIVDDSGFIIEDWGNLPGALAKYFVGEMGAAKITEILGENRRARARTALVYYDGENAKIAVGEIKGRVARMPRGRSGFIVDSIFIADGCGEKTLAELTDTEKSKFSPRTMAAKKLRKILEEAK